MKLPLKAAGI
jgi:hypothetical protein